MKSTNSIFAASGVEATGITPGICRSCGTTGRGELFEEWVKPTFTDHDKLGPGDIVCDACLFCFSDQNERLGALLLKHRPQRFRNYSHFVVRGKWCAFSSRSKADILSNLRAAPEAAVIATSGQKHIAFRCPAGWWQIEEATVRPFPNLLDCLIVPVTELYIGGFSKAEIAAGRFDGRRVRDFGIDGWRGREQLIAPYRGTLALQIAVFLSQQTEENDD